MPDRHTLAVFGAVFSLALTAALSLLSVFYFPQYFIFVYLSCVIAAALAVGSSEMPEYRLCKLAIAVIFPIFAPPFCFLLRRRARRGEAELFLSGAEEPCYRDEGFSSLDGNSDGIVRGLLGIDPYAAICPKSECVYFGDGEEMLESMLKDIDEAASSVLLEYYIISQGRVWDRVLSGLVGCVARGVRVYLLFDDVGSMRSLPTEYAERLRGLGINARVFSPVSSRISIHNNRDHRKLLVIDGIIAYVGGLNLSDEYVNYTSPLGRWKDAGIRLQGNIALSYFRAFFSIYGLSGGKADGEVQEIYTAIDKRNENATVGRALAISYFSAPKPFYRASAPRELILNILGSARKYVYLTTPYLIPDSELLGAIRRASSRGVEVVIVTPGIPDKRLMKALAESFYPSLLSAGVRIFEYTPGFMHAKLLVADDRVVTVGSVNLDYRSLYHNFECGALVFDRELAKTVKADILAALLLSDEIAFEKLGIRKKAIRILTGAILPIL